jgi:non-canonical (house-cleaning) NTP pyrophosphatase
MPYPQALTEKIEAITRAYQTVAILRLEANAGQFPTNWDASSDRQCDRAADAIEDAESEFWAFIEAGYETSVRAGDPADAMAALKEQFDLNREAESLPHDWQDEHRLTARELGIGAWR